MCFASNKTCSKENWSDCDGTWLLTPDLWVFVAVGTVWAFLGVRSLWGEMARNISSRDIVRLHDAGSQGVAVAQAIRFSKQKDWIRQIKIGAIWLEWPAFTLTPLRVFLHHAGIDFNWDFNFSFDGLTEIALVFLSIGIVLTFWAVKMVVSSNSRTTRFRFLYPVVFDFLFISLTATHIRIGLCISGARFITLPDNSTCQCLNRYPFFAILGGAAFILIGSAISNEFSDRYGLGSIV